MVKSDRLCKFALRRLTFFARWLLDRLAAAVSLMNPEENPEDIWMQIVDLPPEAHHWPQVFLNSYFTQNLTFGDVPGSFKRLTKIFAESVFESPHEQWWRSHEDTWQALFGVHYYVRELWQARHIEVANSLWPSMKIWISQESFAFRHLNAVARWLILEAAADVRLDGLGILYNKIYSLDRAASSADSKDAEDAIADLLEMVWKAHKTTIRQAGNLRIAFEKLLQWLSDRQHPLGLELRNRISRL